MRVVQATFLAICVALSAMGSVALGKNVSRALTSQYIPDAVSAGHAPLLGQLDPSTRLRLAISLPLRDEESLHRDLVKIYDPNSPNFHKYLTVAEFTERYGPTKEDYDALIAWANSVGLSVLQTTPNRHILDAEGTVGAINAALGVIENVYVDVAENREFYAPDREPRLSGLPLPHVSIAGLENYYRSHSSTKTVLSPETLGSSSCYQPAYLRSAYYGSGGLTGKGQTVAIVSLDGYPSNDLSLYYAGIGASQPAPVDNVPIDGFDGSCHGNGTVACKDDEQILDITSVLGMAPGVTKILFYEAADTSSTISDLLNRIATDNIAKVVSSSWLGFHFGAADPIFEEFATQGQTYVNSSGDFGQYVETDSASTYAPPALNPYVLVVGGTLLTIDSNQNWISETGWSMSGGGYIAGTYDIPFWQQYPGIIVALNAGSPTWRNSPDVAADAGSGVAWVMNGVFYDNPSAPPYCLGGTSLAAPLWAGLIALANEQSVASGRGTVGFVNPAIYGLQGASYGASFHDITVGNNPPTIGTGGGFSAKSGYDLVTGWGSPTAQLVNLFAGDAIFSSGFETSSTGSIPSAPRNLLANGGNGQVMLSWSAPSSDGGATITSYRVFRGTSSGNHTIVTSGGCANLGATLSCTDSGLSNGTTYYYIVSAVNSAGQGPASNEANATPATVSPPTAVTGSASNIQTSGGASSATLNGQVNPNGQATTAYFEFGFTTSYGATTGSVNVGSGTSAQPVSIGTGSIQPGKTYHFRIVAVSNNGSAFGADNTFSTPATVSPPTAVTGSASNIQTSGGASSATLNGQVNPNGQATTAYFEFGFTTSYGATTGSVNVGSGTSAQPVSIGTGSIQPGKTYHFRIVAVGNNGSAFGADNTFSTPATVSPPTAVTGSASNIQTSGGASSATLNGQVNPNGQATTAYFEFGFTTSYGATTGSVNVGSGTSAQPVSIGTGSIQPGKTYHFRIVAVSNNGSAFGADNTFSTPP